MPFSVQPCRTPSPGSLVSSISNPAPLTTSTPRQPSPLWLDRRRQLKLKICDGVGTFTCGPSSEDGYCYGGPDGFVGCCSASSCAPRTTCIPYTKGKVADCDSDIGGCVVCKAGAPACVTVSNALEDQYIMFCGATATTKVISYLARAAKISQGTYSSKIPSISSISSSTSLQNSTDSAAIAMSTASQVAASPSTIAVKTSRTSSGTIAGIVLGALACVIAVGLVVYFCVFRRLRKQSRLRQAGGLTMSPTPARSLSMLPPEPDTDPPVPPDMTQWRAEVDGLGIYHHQKRGGNSQITLQPPLSAAPQYKAYDPAVEAANPNVTATDSNPPTTSRENIPPDPTTPRHRRSFQQHTRSDSSGPHRLAYASEQPGPPTSARTPPSANKTISDVSASGSADDPPRREWSSSVVSDMAPSVPGAGETGESSRYPSGSGLSVSATGGGIGYVTPEMAIREGWREDYGVRLVKE